MKAKKERTVYTIEAQIAILGKQVATGKSNPWAIANKIKALEKEKGQLIEKERLEMYLSK